MRRRTFIKLAAAILFPQPLVARKTVREFGWIPNSSSKSKGFYELCSGIEGYGIGKSACLYKAFTAVTGHPWLAHTQVAPDCVAQAAGGSVDILTCTRIILERKREKWTGKASVDMIYAGGRMGKNQRFGGMWCSWAVDYLKENGVLLRQPYPPYDLTDYNKETSRYWDRKGIPESLLIEAKEHPLLDSALVSTVEELRDCIASGHPAVLGMSLGGENNQLDEDGFLQPDGEWMHAWCAAGVDDNPRRPGILLINSHSANWGKGPRHLGNPAGSAWVDFNIIDRQLRRHGDSHALTNYRGFKKPDRDYIIW